MYCSSMLSSDGFLVQSLGRRGVSEGRTIPRMFEIHHLACNAGKMILPAH
jgi:hypothetical protein